MNFVGFDAFSMFLEDMFIETSFKFIVVTTILLDYDSNTCIGSFFIRIEHCLIYNIISAEKLLKCNITCA